MLRGRLLRQQCPVHRLSIGSVEATVPDAGRDKARGSTSWPGVSVMGLCEITRLICNFYLSLVACAHSSLRYFYLSVVACAHSSLIHTLRVGGEFNN